jgi:hypothetical protein
MHMDDTTRLLETVGQMAGGIAHDFNDLLAAILGHVEMLSGDLAPGDPRAADVNGIRHAAERATTLTQQLLAISRQQVLQPTVLNLSDVVDRARRLVQRVIGDQIELITCTPRDLRPVKADADQVEQILLNLALNARDAMPRGGRLTLQTRNVDIEDAAAQHQGNPPGAYVQLTVADTGIGIDPAIRKHLFEPFFTTKEPGRGTGLGLATVYGIVKQSGGHIAVESERGRGSRFDVYLPVTLEAPAVAEPPERGSRAERASETVLLVEDDVAVRSLIGDVLRRRGYRLLVAEDGVQALKLADEHASPIHLLITDVAGSAGPDASVADAVRARRPETRVLYLHKPFTPDALARKVRAALASHIW